MQCFTRKYFVLRALGKPLHRTGQRTTIDNLFAAVDVRSCAFNIEVENNCVLVCLLITNNIIQLARISSDGDETNSVSKNFILYNGTVDSNPDVLDGNGGHLKKWKFPSASTFLRCALPSKLKITSAKRIRRKALAMDASTPIKSNSMSVSVRFVISTFKFLFNCSRNVPVGSPL